MCAIERWPEIGTDRLMLRAPVIADAPLVAELANDPVIARNTSRLPHPYGLADAEAWLGAIASQDPHRNRSFAVEDRRLGLIGVLGFDERRPRQTEVGYWFGRPFWGNGFATEALRSFTARAQTLGDLQAGHFVDNPASGRVLEKGGFAYTGETPRLFSLARGESVRCKRMTFAPDLRRAISERASAVLH